MKDNLTILYARVSTKEQASDDHFSIDAQINEMNEYVDKNDLEVIDTFVDGGLSGTLMEERSQLQAALEVVESGECDVF